MKHRPIDFQGHCCPTPVAELCPIGEQLKNASCMDDSCPRENYFCHGIACCPLPCPRGSLYDGETCWPLVDLGDACKYDQQCEGSMHSDKSRHCSNGTCQCRPSFKQTVRAGRATCLINCPMGQVYNGTECAERKKLGETCDPRGPNQCPLNALCSGKQKKCICACNTEQVSEYLCARPAYCPPAHPFNNEPTETPTTKIAYCTDGVEASTNYVSLMTRFFNTTIVSQCAPQQYCTFYSDFGGEKEGSLQFSVGICCQKPVLAMCPYNRFVNAADEQLACTSSNSTACAQVGGLCHRYYRPLNHKSDEGYVCCPGLRRKRHA